MASRVRALTLSILHAVAHALAVGRGAALTSWITSSGGAVGAIDVAATNVGWGLQATGPLSPNDVLVRLPPACVLTEATDADNSKLQELLSPATMPNEFWSARLGLCILNQRALGESSSFTPYLESLPAQIGTPVFWQQEAVEALQPALRVQVNKRARFLAGFAHEHLASGDALRGVAADVGAMAWGCAAASSRAFRLKQGRAMLPLIDSGNHCFDGNAEVRSRADGGVELVASTAIAAGEEVTFSYGALSNDDYLLDYGFIPHDNPYDTTELAWGANCELLDAARGASGGGDAARSAEPLAEWQLAALAQRGLGAGSKVSIGHNGPSTELLAACRVAAAADATALRAADNGEKPLASAAAEAKALRIAAAVVALALAALDGAEGGGEDAAAGDAGTEAAAQLAMARQHATAKEELLRTSLSIMADRIKAAEAKPKKKKAADKPKAKKGGRGGGGGFG